MGLFVLPIEEGASKGEAYGPDERVAELLGLGPPKSWEPPEVHCDWVD